jgi:branched-chain amino acid transport system substrate-binding protein
VLAQMHKTTIHDMYTAHGTIRPDGTMLHDMFLMQVKKPSESKEPWDYYNVVQTLKGDQVFNTKAESTCKFWE